MRILKLRIEEEGEKPFFITIKAGTEPGFFKLLQKALAEYFVVVRRVWDEDILYLTHIDTEELTERNAPERKIKA